MRILLTLVVFAITSCGQPNQAKVTVFDVNTDPSLIVEGAKYYGKSAANRAENFREDNDDGFIKGKDHIGKKANDAREYLYTRGPQEIRHGDQKKDGNDGTNGSTGAVGSTGSQGETGEQGIAGSTGSTGSQGEAGATGETGSQGDQGTQGEAGDQGIAGDDFDGDSRLSDLELRMEALESTVSCLQSVVFSNSSSIAQLDSDLEDFAEYVSDNFEEIYDDMEDLEDSLRSDIRRRFAYLSSITNALGRRLGSLQYTVARMDRRLTAADRQNAQAISALAANVQAEVNRLTQLILGNTLSAANTATALSNLASRVSILESASNEDTTCSVESERVNGAFEQITITCGSEVTSFKAFR